MNEWSPGVARNVTYGHDRRRLTALRISCGVLPRQALGADRLTDIPTLTTQRPSLATEPRRLLHALVRRHRHTVTTDGIISRAHRDGLSHCQDQGRPSGYEAPPVDCGLCRRN